MADRSTAQPRIKGSEAAVRRLSEELRMGKANYDRMSADLRRKTRRQITQHQLRIARNYGMALRSARYAFA